MGSVRNSRRCVTPQTEKRQLVLDLRRRSHSQETIFWNASSELCPSIVGSGAVNALKSVQHLQGSSNNSRRQPNVAMPIICRRSPSAISSSETNSSHPNQASATGGAASYGNSQPIEAGSHNKIQRQLSCIYAKSDDDSEPRRRGKKKKKGKTNSGQTSTFRPPEEPVTQVATSRDSIGHSQRASLVEPTATLGDITLIHNDDRCRKGVGSTVNEKGMRSAVEGLVTEQCRDTSYLDEDVLKQLQRGISVEVVENNFKTLVRMMT